MSRATSLQISAGECGNRHIKMGELCLFVLSLINHLCFHKAQGKVYWNQYKPFSFGSSPLSVFLLLLSLFGWNVTSHLSIEGWPTEEMEPATGVSWEYMNEICIFIERFILKQSSRAKTHQLLLHTDNLHILHIITLLFYSKKCSYYSNWFVIWPGFYFYYHSKVHINMHNIQTTYGGWKHNILTF